MDYTCSCHKNNCQFNSCSNNKKSSVTLKKLDELVNCKRTQYNSVESLKEIIEQLSDIYQTSLDIESYNLLSNYRNLSDQSIRRYEIITNRKCQGKSLLYSDSNIFSQLYQITSDSNFYLGNIANVNASPDEDVPYTLTIYDSNNEQMFDTITVTQNMNSSYDAANLFTEMPTLAYNIMRLSITTTGTAPNLSFNMSINGNSRNIIVNSASNTNLAVAISSAFPNLDVSIDGSSVIVRNNTGENYTLSNFSSNNSDNTDTVTLTINGESNSTSQSVTLNDTNTNNNAYVIRGNFVVYHTEPFRIERPSGDSSGNIYENSNTSSTLFNPTANDLAMIDQLCLLLSEESRNLGRIIIPCGCESTDIIYTEYFETYYNLLLQLTGEIEFVYDNLDITMRTNFIQTLSGLETILDNYLNIISYTLDMYEGIRDDYVNFINSCGTC